MVENASGDDTSQLHFWASVHCLVLRTEHNVSAAESISILRWKSVEVPSQMHPLEYSNLIH
jgi:hypothetical protein